MAGIGTIPVVCKRPDGHGVGIGHADGDARLIISRFAVNIAAFLNPRCAIPRINPHMAGIGTIPVIESGPNGNGVGVRHADNPS